MAGGPEAGDRRGVVCAGLVGLNGCAAYDVNANQVFSWRKLYRDEPRSPAVPSAPQLIPVMVTSEQDAVATQPSTVAATIEIDLAGKYRVRVSRGVDAEALRRVLDVLEQRR